MKTDYYNRLKATINNLYNNYYQFFGLKISIREEDNVYLLAIDDNKYHIDLENGKIEVTDDDKNKGFIDRLNKETAPYSFDKKFSEYYLHSVGIYPKEESYQNETLWNECRGIRYKLFEDDNTTPRVLFDMDGVLAVWNTGKTMEEVLSPGYFRTLEPNMKAIELAKALQDKGFEVCILSKSTYTAINEKFEWLQQYMPFIKPENMYFVPLEADKERFIPHFKERDLAIDDYDKNFAKVNEITGELETVFHGIPVKYITDINNPNEKYINVYMKDDIETSIKIISNAFRDYFYTKEEQELENSSDDEEELLIDRE